MSYNSHHPGSVQRFMVDELNNRIGFGDDFSGCMGFVNGNNFNGFEFRVWFDLIRGSNGVWFGLVFGPGSKPTYVGMKNRFDWAAFAITIDLGDPDLDLDELAMYVYLLYLMVEEL